jgi:hypothetical protein
MENLLSSLAFFDAKHDFKHVAEMHRSIIAESLPGKIFDFPNEEYVLDEAGRFAETIAPLTGNTPNELFTSLGGTSTTPVAIVCDASFCSFLIKLLQKNTIGKVYYVINREVLNDPAPTSVPKEDEALLLVKDVDTKTVEYDKYESGDFLESPRLISKLKVELKIEDGKVITTTKIDSNDVEITTSSMENEISSILYKIIDVNKTLLIQSAFKR